MDLPDTDLFLGLEHGDKGRGGLSCAGLIADAEGALPGRILVGGVPVDVPILGGSEGSNRCFLMLAPDPSLAYDFVSRREQPSPQGHAMRGDPLDWHRAAGDRSCGCSSVVERHVANVNVVSSNLITRSNF